MKELSKNSFIVGMDLRYLMSVSETIVSLITKWSILTNDRFKSVSCKLKLGKEELPHLPSEIYIWQLLHRTEHEWSSLI